jgi:hypothetical protein
MTPLLAAKCKLYWEILEDTAKNLPEDIGTAPDIPRHDLDLMEVLMRDPDIQAHLERHRAADIARKRVQKIKAKNAG